MSEESDRDVTIKIMMIVRESQFRPRTLYELIQKDVPVTFEEIAEQLKISLKKTKSLMRTIIKYHNQGITDYPVEIIDKNTFIFYKIKK